MTECQRKQGARGEHWWYCKNCHVSWNDRNTGPYWRPYNCPERKDKDRRMGSEAYRHEKDHNGQHQ